MRARAAICVLLMLRMSLPASSQQLPNQPGTANPKQESANLKVLIIQGVRAKHNTLTKRAEQTVVEVRNAQDLPQAGARVFFELPASGASGVFPGKKLSMVAVTNQQGQAATSGFVPNEVTGIFSVKVTVTFGKESVTVDVLQENATETPEAVVKKKKSNKTLWILLAVAGGGGAAAAILLSRGGGGGGGGSSQGSIVLVPGPVTVGPPR